MVLFKQVTWPRVTQASSLLPAKLYLSRWRCWRLFTVPCMFALAYRSFPNPDHTPCLLGLGSAPGPARAVLWRVRSSPQAAAGRGSPSPCSCTRTQPVLHRPAHARLLPPQQGTLSLLLPAPFSTVVPHLWSLPPGWGFLKSSKCLPKHHIQNFS